MPFNPLNSAKRACVRMLDSLADLVPADRSHLCILPEPKKPVTKKELLAQLHCAPEHLECVAPPWCDDHVAWRKYMSDMEKISFGISCSSYTGQKNPVASIRLDAVKRLPSLTMTDLFLVARLTPRDPESPWLVDVLEEEMKERRIPKKLRGWMRGAAA